MSWTRRHLLKHGLSGLAAMCAATLLQPLQAWAAWPKQAFNSKQLDASLQNLFGSQPVQHSSAIEIQAPETTDNTELVTVTISTGLPQVSSIYLLVSNNPQPLNSIYEISPSMEPYISSRIKVAKTSELLAVVKSEQQLYSARKTITVNHS